MKDKKQTSKLLIAITIISILLACYGLMKKRGAAQILNVSLTPYSIEEHNNSIHKFWDNYPDLVLQNRNKSIDPNFRVNSHYDIKRIIKNGNTLFLRARLQHVEKSVDSLLIMQIKTAIKNNGTKLFILPDKDCINIVKGMNLDPGQVTVLTVENKLPLIIEEEKLSYFFRIEQGFKVNDIYVPRRQTPELLEKYLEFQNTKVMN